MEKSDSPPKLCKKKKKKVCRGRWQEIQPLDTTELVYYEQTADLDVSLLYQRLVSRAVLIVAADHYQTASPESRRQAASVMSLSLRQSRSFCYLLLASQTALSLPSCHINYGSGLGPLSNSHLTPLELDLVNPTMITANVVNQQVPYNAGAGGWAQLEHWCASLPFFFRCRGMKGDESAASPKMENAHHLNERFMEPGPQTRDSTHSPGWT